MQKICLLILTTCTAGLLQLEAQYSVPYSTNSVQGSTVITNYYDPNSGPDVGPGFAPSPLESRFSGPLTQFGTQPSSVYPTATYAPATVIGAPATVVGIPGTVVQQQVAQQPALYPQQQVPQAQRGPVLLNPIPGQSALQLPAQVEEPVFHFPGLVTKMNGKWIASEYLYDLPSDIGILVEVIKPDNRQINVDTQILKDAAATLFLKDHFNPESLAIGNDPPLPFFFILIFVYPDENKTFASISGRLFEKVKIARLDYNLPGTYQAITWEKTDLIITSPLQFSAQLVDSVRDIVAAFLKEVHYFDVQKVKQESGFKVIGTREVIPRPERTLIDDRGYRCP